MRTKKRPGLEALEFASEWLRAHEGKDGEENGEAELVEVAEWLDSVVAKARLERQMVNAVVEKYKIGRQKARRMVQKHTKGTVV